MLKIKDMRKLAFACQLYASFGNDGYFDFIKSYKQEIDILKRGRDWEDILTDRYPMAIYFHTTNTIFLVTDIPDEHSIYKRISTLILLWILIHELGHWILWRICKPLNLNIYITATDFWHWIAEKMHPLIAKLYPKGIKLKTRKVRCREEVKELRKKRKLQGS